MTTRESAAYCNTTATQNRARGRARCGRTVTSVEAEAANPSEAEPTGNPAEPADPVRDVLREPGQVRGILRHRLAVKQIRIGREGNRKPGWTDLYLALFTLDATPEAKQIRMPKSCCNNSPVHTAGLKQCTKQQASEWDLAPFVCVATCVASSAHQAWAVELLHLCVKLREIAK